MGRLTEKYVQNKSITFLKEYYNNRYNPAKIFAKQEVRTKPKYGKKRADGLICFNSNRQKLHVISLEAKSHKTLSSLLPYWNDYKYSVPAILLPIILGLSTIFLTNDLSWYWILSITLISTIILFIIVNGILTIIEPNLLKSLNVVNQINQYPTNEKWIATSKDSMNLVIKMFNEFHNASNYDNLISICKSNGLGLILVTGKKVEIEIEPKYKKGNYLNYYSINKEIEEILTGYNMQIE